MGSEGRFPQRLVRGIRLCACLALVVSIVSLRFGSASSNQRRQAEPSLSNPDLIEFEDLVTSAKPSAGEVSRQDMRPFGRGWSRNAQMFWAAPPPVGNDWPHLSVMYPVAVSGTYEMYLHYTKAPDYGQFNIYLDGKPAAYTNLRLEGYASTVGREVAPLGKRLLNAGNHQLEVKTAGRAHDAQGSFVGLDYLELKRLDAPMKNPGPATTVKKPGL